MTEKPRRLYQTLGHDIGRGMLSEDIWIDYLILQYKDSSFDFIVVDDVRYDNEARTMRTLIAIDPAQNKEAYQKNTARFTQEYLFAAHASEQGITVPPTYTIAPGFTDSDVKDLVHKLLEERTLYACTRS